MPNNSFCTSAGSLSHSANRSSSKLAVRLGNLGQLLGAIRRRHGHQRPQIPAQLGHAQAQLALVGVERFVFAHLGQNLGLALRRTDWSAPGPARPVHREQFAEEGYRRPRPNGTGGTRVGVSGSRHERDRGGGVGTGQGRGIGGRLGQQRRPTAGGWRRAAQPRRALAPGQAHCSTVSNCSSGGRRRIQRLDGVKVFQDVRAGQRGHGRNHRHALRQLLAVGSLNLLIRDEGRAHNHSGERHPGQPAPPRPGQPSPFTPAQLRYGFPLDGLQHARREIAGHRRVGQPAQACVQPGLGFPVSLRLGMGGQPGPQLGFLGSGKPSAASLAPAGGCRLGRWSYHIAFRINTVWSA